MMARVAVLVGLCLLAVSKEINAHGWIKEPASRNLMAQGEDGFYQQMSLNR